MAELLIHGLREEEAIILLIPIKKESRRWEESTNLKIIRIKLLGEEGKKKVFLEIGQHDWFNLNGTKKTLDTFSVDLVSKIASIINIKISYFYRFPNFYSSSLLEEGKKVSFRIEEI